MVLRPSGYELAVNLPYAIALAAVVCEVAWLARRPGDRRRHALRSLGTSAVMAAGALAVSTLYTVLLRTAWSALAALRWEPAARLWQAAPVLGAVAAFVAWDAAGWLYHRVGHRTAVGWAAHQVHHTGEHYDATLGLRQTWVPFHGLVHQPLLALAGFDLRVVIVCAAVSNCWQVLLHTSLPVRFPGWFEATVMTPRAHRRHHGVDGAAVNLGPVLTVWDRLAGTWRAPTGTAPPLPATGGSNPFAIELAGWRDLVQRRLLART